MLKALLISLFVFTQTNYDCEKFEDGTVVCTPSKETRNLSCEEAEDGIISCIPDDMVLAEPDVEPIPLFGGDITIRCEDIPTSGGQTKWTYCCVKSHNSGKSVCVKSNEFCTPLGIIIGYC